MEDKVKIQITKDEFLDYETVKRSGFYNMLDSQAREMTDLSREQWVTIIENYSELKNKYIGDNYDK